MRFRKKCFEIICVMSVLIVGACAGLNRDPASRYSGQQLQLMGEKFLAAGDLGQALKFLTLAEKKRPKDPVIHYDLGLAYGARGLPIDAQRHFEKALSLRPDYPEAHNALGAFFAEQGQLDKAEENFQKALANPLYQAPHYALYNLGRVYEKKGDHEAALRYYREAVRLQAYYGTAYFRMGRMLEVLRRGDEAKDAYGKAIEYSPDNVEAHLRFGIMSYSTGEIENALYSLSRVTKLAPYSNMASEARKYLERLESIVAGETLKTATIPASERMSQLEVVSDKESMEAQSPSLPLPVSVTDKERKSSGTRIAHAEPPPVISPDTQWTYIVQVASFLDRENAETLRRRLSSNGYEAVLKPFVHPILGPIYIIQLKSVDDPARASTLMANIENEERIKPIIIKVPANL